eukprot:gene29193-38260_t
MLQTLEGNLTNKVAVYCPLLAAELQMSAAIGNIADEEGLMLRRNLEDGALEILWGPQAKIKEKPFRIDFADKKFQFRMSRSSPAEELLCKAVGPALTVLDLTAGLGRDGLVLAASMPGRRVLLFERNPVLFHLLRDAIVRLRRENPDLAQRLRIELRDSARDYLEIGQDCAPELEETVSVYLDPMYPAAHTARRTAKSGKETQFLHRLAGGATTESETTDNLLLFQSAARLSSDRIVVKRPLNGQPLVPTSFEPVHHVFRGSTQQFDVYFKSRLRNTFTL